MERPAEPRSEGMPEPDGGGVAPRSESLGGEVARPRKSSDAKAHRGKTPARFPGSEFLSGASTRDVLVKIVEGDPLEIGELALERLRERALMLDTYRVTLRAMARTARAAMSYRGTPDLTTWLRSRIDESIDDAILEDREEERLALPAAEGGDARYAFLSEALGVEPGLARRMCVIFNDLPDEQRRAFCSIVMEGKSLNRHVAEGNGPPSKVRELLVEVLRKLSLPEDGFDFGDVGDGL